MDVQDFSPELTRRAFLRNLPPVVAAAICFHSIAGTAAAVTAPGRFSFFQINDLHFLEKDCATWFRAVVAQMKASAPDAELCLLCGDLADKGAEDALRAVSEIFAELTMPVLPVPGNHDFTPQESRAGYDAIFPGKLNYSVEHRGWQFLGLDTTMGTKFAETIIGEPTLRWLDEKLAELNPSAPTIAFTHFPLGEGVTYRPKNADALIERLLKLNLAAVFSGHWHGASERHAKATVLTTSRCCARVRNNADGSPLKGWFVCDARPDGSLTRRFVEFQAPPGIPLPNTAAPQSPLK